MPDHRSATRTRPGDSFAKLPTELVRNQTLPDRAKTLYAEICTYAWEALGTDCYASQATLAGDLGWSVRKVQMAAGELLKHGYITRTRTGRTNHYRPVAVESCGSDTQDVADQIRKGLRTKQTTEPDDAKQERLLSTRARAETAEDRRIGEPNSASREESDPLTERARLFSEWFYDGKAGTSEDLDAARRILEEANGDRDLIMAVREFATSDGFWLGNGYVETLPGFAKHWPRLLSQHRAKSDAGTEFRPARVSYETFTCYEHGYMGARGSCCPECAEAEALRFAGTAIAA